ncbi:ChrR family anti-sigma-E factor [Roseobacter sp. HKCCA0882]|uniref:ChrR family anti-sigma-E factor n=1 Tax=Roseobacter sp. HKCCA0882 TaxID=3120337 RepID=UPI0030EE9103
MTEVKHHISDDFLIGYAAGSLPAAFDLVVATHVSLSDDARARLHAFDAIGGCILDEMDEAPLAQDSLSKTLSLINESAASEAASSQNQTWPEDDIFPAPLRDTIGCDLADVKWRLIGMGCKQAIISEGKDATARLLFIPAGQAMPRHTHRGTEMTLVLQGAYRDETDRFGRGDIEIGDETMNHTPVAEAGEDCVCLIATDARLRFEGLLPRIAQTFLRI